MLSGWFQSLVLGVNRNPKIDAHNKLPLYFVDKPSMNGAVIEESNEPIQTGGRQDKSRQRNRNRTRGKKGVKYNLPTIDKSLLEKVWTDNSLQTTVRKDMD